MTFQNLCSNFRCTHEESLSLWDYLMFLRVKSMLKQAPLPAITKEEMEFEKSREASPLTMQRWLADAFGIPVEQIKADEKKEAIASAAFKLMSETQSEIELERKAARKVERDAQIKAHIDAWKNCVVGTSKVGAIHGNHISPVDLQMVLCERCKMELYFGKVPDGIDIVCFQCGYMTKFNYEAPE